MKITRIQVDGILGIQSVDVKTKAPISLFAGKNGSGKSSIQESVRMAICQDHVRDVTVKKNFDMLVHEGVKAGGAQVTMNNDPENSFAFNMPKGDFTGPEIPESMRVALNGQRFAKMDEKERRTFLFGLTKLKPNAEAVKARMLARGCDETRIDAVLPLLRTGFPGCCDHAKTKATEEKGAWGKLAGGVWGSVKSESWVAPLPENVTPDADAVRAGMVANIASLDKNIAAMNENLGAVKNAARQAKEQVAKRATLHTQAMTVDRCRDNLERAKGELDEYEPTVVALRTRAAGKARIGLVHDMLDFIITSPIPELGEEYEIKAEALIERYEAEHGKVGQEFNADAQSRLPEHEKGLLVMQNRVTNLQRDLDAAIKAKADFDALAPADNGADSDTEIANIEGMLATARTDRTTIEAKRAAIEAEIKAIADAGTKTKTAQQYHQNVLAWTKVAEALAPDGIPGEMLKEALAPVNTKLQQAALDTDWMQVSISSDMAITANDRPYNLLSESEQWRCDAMIAQVVAEISGLNILMLDRVDVLDLPGRAELFGWLAVLADDGIIETALLFATLKGLPTGLDQTVEAFWVEGGKIVMPKLQAAA